MAPPSADPGSIGVSGERYDWPLTRLACSFHHSFAWNGPAVDPKNCVTLDRSWGERHKLSLLAQFAAHQAFLAFAGLSDGAFDPGEWMVVKPRGSDVRLLRVAARLEDEWSGATPYDRVTELASWLGIDSVAALGQPWGRPDRVYAEVRSQLASGNAADRSSVERAAFGAVLSPGEDLDRLLQGPSEVDDDCFRALASFARLASRPLIEIGGSEANPLARGSGLELAAAAIEGLSADDVEGAVAALLDARDLIVIVPQPERLDPTSRAVVDRLVPEERQVALGREPDSERDGLFTPTRHFILAPTAESQRELLSRLPEAGECEPLAALERLCSSETYDRFLGGGPVPELCTEHDVTVSITEPARSFLSALALLGPVIDLALASRFLAGIGALVTPVELARPGIAVIDGGTIRFASDEVRRQLERRLSAEMIDSLIGTALQILEGTAPLTRARLALRRNEPETAAQILAEALEEGSLEEGAVRGMLGATTIADSALVRHPRLAIIEGECRFARGAYRSALDLVGGIAQARARLVAARACRRIGRYAEAIEILEETEPSFRVNLIKGVLHRLEGHFDRAAQSSTEAEALAGDDPDRVSLAFERALLSLDLDEKPDVSWKRAAKRLCPWLVARFDMHEKLGRGDYTGAADCAERAIASSPDLVDRIDAHVDLVFALFMAGKWERAATAARDALRVVEETEGDRAGGGLLFILGYLSADDGRWREAETALAKLEPFYEENRDDRRKRELDLIRAQVALGKLEYDAARSAATRAESCENPEIRYAAKLVIDELDWIRGSLPMPRVDGKTGCAELARRTDLIRARAGSEADLEGFSAELAAFERAALNGSVDPPPEPGSASERLMLIRSIDAIHRRLGSQPFADQLDALCASAGIHRTETAEPVAQRFLIALARSEMPPAELPIAGVEWRFAVRNRLGAWRQYGSLPDLESSHLEVVVADDDVLRVGDTGLLWLEGEIEWTPDLREAVAMTWQVKWEHRNFQRINEQMTATVRDDVPVSEDGIIGESSALREAMGRIPPAAKSDLAVTIEGETGTGKEAFARAIHRRSSRRGRPFTPVNSSALPENLVESELFGHARGAFTGADRERIGLVEATDGGTLFLDEMGEMPLAIQAKLLRFLQEGEFRRVGETEVRTADVRIVAATNLTLEEEVDAGRFRQDLYYRIKGFEIQLPPLRRRGNDILLLARHFLARLHDAAKSGPFGFTDEAEAHLFGYQWPGNVRELQSVVGSAFSLAGEAPLITLDHLPQRLRTAASRPSKHGTYYEELAQFRRQMIETSLLEAGGNQSRAAKNLGMTRQALSYQIKELGIRVKR